MKFIRKNKTIRYVLPVLLVAFLIGWIVKLELNAAQMQTQWEKLKQSLEQNRDELTNIERFTRTIGTNMLIMDPNNIGFSVGDNVVNVTKYYGQLSNPKSGTMVSWDDKKIQLELNNSFRITLDNTANNVVIAHEDAYMTVGNFTMAGSAKQYDGILMANKWSSGKTTQYVLSNDGVQLVSTGVPITVGYFANNEYCGLKLRPADDLIQMIKGNSKIKFEKDEIEFAADGDIKITSKNGDVVINGKKVKVNE